MRNSEAIFENRVGRPKYHRRTVITASSSEKAFDQANRVLGRGMSWVAGLSVLYLLLHLLRWASNA